MPKPELGPFEYAMGLFSVIIGLAVTDIAISFHRLMRSRREIRWDPLALAAAVYTLCTAVYMWCTAVYMWFDLWGVRNFEATRGFFFYLALVIQLVVMFLAAAASLPDEATGNLDLSKYYDENGRYFWSLLTLFQAGYTLDGIYFGWREFARAPPLAAVLLVTEMAAPMMVCFALVLFRRRVAHWVGLAVLFGLMAVHYGPARIG